MGFFDGHRIQVPLLLLLGVKDDDDDDYDDGGYYYDYNLPSGQTDRLQDVTTTGNPHRMTSHNPDN